MQRDKDRDAASLPYREEKELTAKEITLSNIENIEKQIEELHKDYVFKYFIIFFEKFLLLIIEN